MKKLAAAIFTTIAIVLAISAVAAATPPPPPQPPAAYAQTAFYDACTDWFLQSTWPMSVSDPKWSFLCSNGSPDSGSEDGWYWNADLQAAIWFHTAVWDWGWYWDCTAYPYGLDGGGACDA